MLLVAVASKVESPVTTVPTENILSIPGVACLSTGPVQSAVPYTATSTNGVAVPSTAGLVLFDGAAGFVPARTGARGVASKIVIVASESSGLTVAPTGPASQIWKSSSASAVPSLKICTAMAAEAAPGGTVSVPAARW